MQAIQVYKMASIAALTVQRADTETIETIYLSTALAEALTNSDRKHVPTLRIGSRCGQFGSIYVHAIVWSEKTPRKKGKEAGCFCTEPYASKTENSKKR